MMAQQTTSIPVNFHHGQVMTHLAQMHGDGFSAMTELVQNLLDAVPTSGLIIIDAKSNKVTALDDGRGAGLAEITRKFSEIGNSQKKDDATAIGKKGVGGLSAYVIADTWEFTTREKKDPHDPFRMYTLDSSQFKRVSDIKVRVEKLEMKSFAENTLGVPATTRVVLHNVGSSVINQLIAGREELVRSLQMTFNDKLKQTKAKLVIECRRLDGTKHRDEVKPREFRGIAQDSIKVETEYGSVKFTLFLNPKPLCDPVVRISYTDPLDSKRYGFPIALITTGRTKTSAETKTFFEKGYFEGTISLDFGSMTPNRLGFIDNAEYKAFIHAVNEVVSTTLSKVLEKLEFDQHDDKLRQVGDRVLGKLKTYLENNPAMRTQVTGKISSLFTGTDSPTEPSSFISMGRRRGGGPPKETKPKQTLVRETHEKVKSGETRKDRKISPNTGIGIVFVYPGDEESFNWKHRIRAGVVEFNCADDRFVKASGRSALFLEEYCTMMMLAVITEVTQPSPQTGDSKLVDLWLDLQLQGK